MNETRRIVTRDRRGAPGGFSLLELFVGNAVPTTILPASVRAQNGDKGLTAAWSDARKTFLLTARLLIPGGGTECVYRSFGLQVSPRL